MPLPFVLIPIVAKIGIGVAAGIATGKAIHSHGKRKGARAASEEYFATINDLKGKLYEMQKQREETKNGFQEVINDIARIEVSDTNFLSKVASLLKGYNNFQVYVITCISYCRYQVVKLKFSNQDCNEMKVIVLGLVQAGFPNNLKKDIDTVWQCDDFHQIISTFHKYKGKLDKTLQFSIDETIFKMNEYLQGYSKLSLHTKKLEEEIALAS